jgi:hypothetical protein
MVDFNGIGGTISGYFGTSAFWVTMVVILVLTIVVFYGYFSRKSKLKYNCLELVRFGNGKVGINSSKAGLFKSKTFLYFFDYGRESRMKTSEGRVIENAKTSYLHDIFGKKGFVVVRSPKDPKILIPISKIEFDGLELLFEIAPAEYRDASVRIYREAVDETKGLLDKILPYIMVGLCVFLCIITVVICMQMTNHATDKVGGILIEGCSNKANVQPSTTAP